MPIAVIDSPVGTLEVEEREEQIVRIRWAPELPTKLDPSSPILERTCIALERYFSGTAEFFEVPLSPIGSEFQLSVWREMQAIPRGETRDLRRVGACPRQPAPRCRDGLWRQSNPHHRPLSPCRCSDRSWWLLGRDRPRHQDFSPASRRSTPQVAGWWDRPLLQRTTVACSRHLKTNSLPGGSLFVLRSVDFRSVTAAPIVHSRADAHIGGP